MDLDQADQILRDETTDDPAEIGREATCSATQAVVWHNGRIAYDAAYGKTEPGSRGRTVGPTTPFDVASLTKPLVVGTLLMQAVREELCHWYDPVDDYLGDWSADDRAGEVTILQLANHTSGLPDWRPLYDDLPADPEPADVTTNRRRILTDIYHTAFDAPPGDAECYSDLGYIVLGCLLESLFGGSLDELARERIFEPLGMDRTQFVSAAAGDAALDGAAAT